MPARVSAVPHLLLTHATVAGEVADDLHRAAGELAAALAAVRAEGTPVDDVDLDVAGLATRLRALGEFVHAVGAAFASAGECDTTGRFVADAGAIDGALDRPWRPRAGIVPMEPSAWWRAVWGDKCFSGDQFYVGKGHGITGPDGRLYPLVSPSVRRDRQVYNADWGRGDAPRVGDLFGADPGWRVVDVETGVERHRGELSLLERLLVGIGSTVQGPPNGSSKEEVEAVVLERDRLPRVERVPAMAVAPELTPSLPSHEVPAVAAAQLAPAMLDGIAGALEAGDGAHHAYQVVFEENVDGRLRATYLRVDLTPGTDSKPPTLGATHVLGPEDNERVLVRYLGPDGAR